MAVKKKSTTSRKKAAAGRKGGKATAAKTRKRTTGVKKQVKAMAKSRGRKPAKAGHHWRKHPVKGWIQAKNPARGGKKTVAKGKGTGRSPVGKLTGARKLALNGKSKAAAALGAKGHTGPKPGTTARIGTRNRIVKVVTVAAIKGGKGKGAAGKAHKANMAVRAEKIKKSGVKFKTAKAWSKPTVIQTGNGTKGRRAAVLARSSKHNAVTRKAKVHKRETRRMSARRKRY